MVTFINFPATLPTYFPSALQTQKIREVGWSGKRGIFLKNTLPMCVRDTFSGDYGASCPLVCFWHLGIREREGLNTLFSFVFPWLPSSLSCSRSAPTQEIITCT